MANKDLILDLGKLMIGVAWVDGELHPDEINALKELLFLLPDISGEDWIQLEIYMTHAVTESERKDLLERVLNKVRSAQDKQLVLDTLEKLMMGHDIEEQETSTILETIRKDIEGKSTGLFNHLTGPLRQALKSRSSHFHGTPSREDRLEDFIKNTIYFQLTSEMHNQGRTLSFPEPEARKICLAAGLMAHVAWVDYEVCHRERAAMSLGLQQLWNLPQEEADLIVGMSHARIMHGLDLVRLTTGFREYTTIEERKGFLRCLFAISNAADQTSHAEIEEIRRIALAFELPHQEFINAKLTIPREDRGGL